MNAHTAPDHLAEQVVELVPLTAIVPSDSHIQCSRRRRFRPEAIAELAESIKSVGLQQPIIVREAINRGGTKYELVAGERRWLAAEKAGLAHISAIVRNLTDEEIVEVQLVENLQREGLHELEEAEGYEELMNLRGISAEAVGEIVGRSRSYVYARLKLLTLSLEAREAFYRGDLDSSRALYVARITVPKLQERALKLALEKSWHQDGFALSVRQLRDELGKKRITISLKTAPFDPADIDLFQLVKVGKGREESRDLPACTDCPHRTGNATDLFNRFDDPDVCTNPPCYDDKVKAHTIRLRQAAEASGKQVIAGEAAKAIAPRRDTLVGFVDLDATCDSDQFPEPEPHYPEDAEEGSAEMDAYNTTLATYEAREAEHRGRTYRQLLGDAAGEPTLIEDPKTKQIRSLLPVKEARAALKAKGIELPTWIAGTTHDARAPTKSPAEYAKERQRLLEREEKERAYRLRVLTAIAGKWTGPLRREDLVDIADDLIGEWNRQEALKAVYGGKLPEPGQLKDLELSKLIALGLVAHAAHPHTPPAPLFALAKRLKIDIVKLKAEPKLEESEAPKKKPAKAAPAKKAGGNKAKGNKSKRAAPS